MSVSRQNRLVWIALASAPVLLAAIAFLQIRIDEQTRSVAKQKEEVLLTSGPLLKKLSLGYDSLLADIYWTRVVQYYGGKLDMMDPHMDLLPALLDLTTTLDPKLIIAYRYGGIFLAERQPVGYGRPDLAAEFVRRGLAANPNEWRLDFDLGFIYFWQMRDYAKASAAFLDGSKIPGAPDWMASMAARMADRSKELENARALWSEIYRSTQSPKVKAMALARLTTLKVLMEEGWLNDEYQEYLRRFGRPPKSTEDLKAAGIIPGVPIDPAGFAYIFGPDGQARLDPRSPVVIEPLPEAPSAFPPN